MEWKTTLHPENKYIEIVTNGIVDMDSSLNMAKTITSTLKQHRFTKVLIDHRDIESVSGGTTDIYDRPKLFRMIGVILRIKIAEIIKPEHLEHFRFLETVCRNRGYSMSIFYDKPTALDWLLNK